MATDSRMILTVADEHASTRHPERSEGSLPAAAEETLRSAQGDGYSRQSVFAGGSQREGRGGFSRRLHEANVHQGRRLKPPLPRGNRLLRFLHDDRGAATTSFILAFPIFLVIVGIVVQMALMVNAKIIVNHAADVAARAAVTSLPDGHPENISQAALIALAPLSPKAGSSSSEAQTIYSALQQAGANVAESFPARYSYAQQATQISWTPDSQDMSQSVAQPVEVTVTYRFQLTVPGIMKMAQADEDTVAGVHGWFWSVTGKCQVQTSQGRKVNVSDDGSPQ